MKLGYAREIVTYCEGREYKDMLVMYRHWEITLAIRTIEARKSATDTDKRYADIVYWKIALRPIK